jgi:hypothetical protein
MKQFDYEVQSINNNLREIQQEDEIVFFDELPERKRANQSSDSVKETDQCAETEQDSEMKAENYNVAAKFEDIIQDVSIQ